VTYYNNTREVFNLSIKDKFAVLKLNSKPVKPVKGVLISEDWSKLLSSIEPVYPEMHQYFLWLAKQGVLIKNEGTSEKRIVLDSAAMECLPAITIEINPEKRWPDGAILY